jgi:spore coat polysaccharide biosynthesis protein SpsF
MLALLANRSLLEWVVTRVRKSSLIERVVVATTQEPFDNRLVEECARLQVEVVRGATDDVLSRFIDALRSDVSDQVVRVCADNPFIDGGCIDAVIREHLATSADYSFNHRPYGECNYADGFGAEVVSRALLERLHTLQLSASHREHVTLAVADGTVQARIHGCIAPAKLARPELRFDVDVPADLVRLESLVQSGALHLGSTASDVISASDHMGLQS